MKKLIVLLFTVISVNSYSQNVADSTIASMAKFNCECHDTININRDDEIIKKNLRDCFTYSLATFLNTGEITPDYLNDNKKLNSLQGQVFNKLADCKKTVAIVQRLSKIPIPLDSTPNELFVNKEFFTKHGLKEGEVGKQMRVWNSDKNEHIQRVVDIRWVFKTNEDALRFHKAKLEENSENGQKVKADMKLAKATDLYMFKESKEVEGFIKMMNLPQRQHYFLFVVDNVVYKVFVATDKTLEPKNVKFIVDEAIDRKKEYKD